MGKMAICEIKSYRRTVLLSSWWKPWITKTSFCGIRVAASAAHHSEDGSTELREMPEFAVKPHAATIPVAVGNNRGQALAVGMKFAAAGPLDDNLCIGIVGIRDNLLGQKVFSIRLIFQQRRTWRNHYLLIQKSLVILKLPLN